MCLGRPHRLFLLVPRACSMAFALSPVVVRKLGQVGHNWKKKDDARALEELVVFLKKHKEHIAGAHYIVTQGMVPLIMRSQRRETLPPCTTHLKVVSLGLKKKCILAHSDIEKEALKVIHGKTSKSIDDLFIYMVDEAESYPVTKHFEDDFMEWVAQKQARAGSRLKSVKVAPDGSIDWASSGLFSLGCMVGEKYLAGVASDGFYSHALHRFAPLCVVVLPKETVDATWVFESNMKLHEVRIVAACGLSINISSLLEKQNPVAFGEANRVGLQHNHLSKRQQAESLQKALSHTELAVGNDHTESSEHGVRHDAVEAAGVLSESPVAARKRPLSVFASPAPMGKSARLSRKPCK